MSSVCRAGQHGIQCGSGVNIELGGPVCLLSDCLFLACPCSAQSPQRADTYVTFVLDIFKFQFFYTVFCEQGGPHCYSRRHVKTILVRKGFVVATDGVIKGSEWSRFGMELRLWHIMAVLSDVATEPRMRRHF